MKLIVADDHTIVRKGFQLIASTRPGWSVAEAANADELLRALRSERFDLLVLDVSLGDRSSIELLGQLQRDCPELPVLMLSMHPEEQYAIRCLRAGAHGYIQKDSPAEDLLAAITSVARGGTYISPRLAGHLAHEIAHKGVDAPHARLSAREFEVFRLIALGRSVTDIAEMLSLSVKTVSTYRTRILEKTGFHSNADIIGYAIRNGLV